ncbi:hypothetical protein BH11PSE11_BH11PSE11_27650 [soil metagenome]
MIAKAMWVNKGKNYPICSRSQRCSTISTRTVHEMDLAGMHFCCFGHDARRAITSQRT